MDRKESIKTMFLGMISFPFLKKEGDRPQAATKTETVSFESNWDQWPDVEWVGPQFWGNRLQDWQIRDGRVRCSVRRANRSLHCLSHQIGKQKGVFKTAVIVEKLFSSDSEKDRLGFQIGSKASDDPVEVSFDDYRRDAVFGKGLDVGIQGDGRLFIGTHTGQKPVKGKGPVKLVFRAEPVGENYLATLLAKNSKGDLLSEISTEDIDPSQLEGNLALLADIQTKENHENKFSALFSDWHISGSKIVSDTTQVFGPICFAQYTLDRKILKMTAQMAPVEAIKDHRVELQIRRHGQWKTLQQTTINPMSRTAYFRQENWEETEDTAYRVKLTLPLKNENKEYYYEGTISADPVSSDQLKTAVFSCNSHYGFPNQEVVDNVSKHSPDMAVFLGDQLYESHGGFGVQRAPIEKAALDWLRKWYMFGWSYREIFRHIPSAFIPDDHDVYHGNIWGEGGADAPVEKGWGYNSQDEGGYKMPPKWVNMVQRAQTSNLPDPYDPIPAGQNIGVYFTDWTYGGVSFAIIEDRKFKTAPKNVLPEKAKVVNGFIQNRDFDIKEFYDIEANLLGDRQLDFLEHWAGDWGYGARMKAVLSQTNFCTVATLPEGSILDQIVPKLPIPERGTYVKGDAPTTDMDSNGWPQKGRDKALQKIRKGFALHIAGDQHLASTVHYGVDEYGDAGFAFAGPALNNIWPRRWWPPVSEGHEALPGHPPYTGDFEDGFGNKMSVYAVANPVQTNRKPGLIYDRATGYGMITFDKKERTIKIECWPRFVDPEENPEGQYYGWPIVIDQQDNYGRRASGYLPELEIKGLTDPVVQVFNEGTGELEYALRINGNRFSPKIFDPEATYRVRVGEPDQDLWQEFTDLHVNNEQKKISCIFEG